MNWIKSILAHIVGFHRTALVLGTAILSIAASRIAETSSEMDSWSLLVSGAALIAWSDLARDLNQRAERLAGSSEAPIGQARRDVVVASAGIEFVVALVVWAAALVVGGVLRW